MLRVLPSADCNRTSIRLLPLLLLLCFIPVLES
jgi:hypothetical protein